MAIVAYALALGDSDRADDAQGAADRNGNRG